MADSPRATLAELRTAFARQRRNLMAVSIIAALYISAGIQIDKVSLFGNTWTVTRPEVISFGVVATYFYFLVRYYQHLRDLGDPGPREAFASRVGELAKRRAIVRFRARFPRQFESEKTLTNVHFSHKTYGNGEPYGKWHFVFEGTMSFAWPDGSSGITAFSDQRLEEPVTRADRIEARLWVAANTRFFTEYYLPFVVASLPAIGLAYILIARAAA